MDTSTIQSPSPAPRTYERLGVQIPTIYLPKPGIDLTKWAVVACDQFTSEPEYWQQVENLVGDAPSTLNMILPEYYLGKPEEPARIQDAQKKMRAYLSENILIPHQGMVYVERTIKGHTRRGLVLCLDLEHYDYRKGSSSLIRATEATIVERLPPRMKIRQGAALELPHILVLIDDPQCTVIEPVDQARNRLEQVYDFDLMLGSGHLAGYCVNDPALEAGVIKALEALADPEVFKAKYNLKGEYPVLLFAMGDGNHSLATAKSFWEKIKDQVGPDHPARYALVEIENVHDEALEFEPIHRVLFGLKTDLLAEMKQAFGDGFTYLPCSKLEEVTTRMQQAAGASKQVIGVVQPGGFGVIEITHPTSTLAVGTLQPFLDQFLKAGKAEGIDYVHGDDVVCRLAEKPGNIGFFLPNMSKSDLFKTVILDGALPRKTFSMGEAREKRFYMESRQIV